MKLRGLLTDRQPLITALEQRTGKSADYSGAPSFRYTIGDYTVLRDGSLEVADRNASRELLLALAGLGLIENPELPADGIAVDASDFTGRVMCNIVNQLAAKELLINRAIGVPNAFHMKADFVRELKAVRPTTMAGFMDVLHQCGGESAMRGIRLSGNTLIFTGFPDTDACRALAEHMVDAAKSVSWIKAKAVKTENDKYSFRVWLNAIGMKGPELADARAELMKNLSGNSTFRTQAQRDAFYVARKQKSKKKEPEFIVL